MVTVGTTSLTIGSQNTAGTYDIYDNVLTCSGDANKAISAVGTKDDELHWSFEAIVLPNNTTNLAVDRTVTIVVDGRSYTFTIGKATSFDTGKRYVYNVKVYPLTITVDTGKYTEQW
jgi:hypothetical protein